MCGNFGLLLVQQNSNSVGNNEIPNQSDVRTRTESELDVSLHRSMHEVSRVNGLQIASELLIANNNNIAEGENDLKKHGNQLLNPIDILKCQTSCTEVRGGQAGGISYLKYTNTKRASSAFADQFAELALMEIEPQATRFVLAIVQFCGMIIFTCIGLEWLLTKEHHWQLSLLIYFRII